MAYHFSKTIKMPFEKAIDEVTLVLQQQGFGILTTIDVAETLKKKLNVDFRKYKILGACNPQFAHQALSMEPNIGVMLPCNIAVQEIGNGEVEVSAINPMETMAKSVTMKTPALKELAAEVSERLKTAVEALN